MKNLNKNNLPDSESETLTQENIFNELILNSIRIKSGINLTQIKNDFNIETQQNILNKANEWGENLTIKSDCIKLSRKGMPIADEITLDLATSLITSK